ncbi:hypothetical protein [Apis mellifera associated microvirus 57]|nr:hypothetical protein [Apis mellifera associated microvirus 57]
MLMKKIFILVDRVANQLSDVCMFENDKQALRTFRAIYDKAHVDKDNGRLSLMRDCDMYQYDYETGVKRIVPEYQLMVADKDYGVKDENENNE